MTLLTLFWLVVAVTIVGHAQYDSITVVDPTVSAVHSCSNSASRCDITVSGTCNDCGEVEYHCPQNNNCTQCNIDCQDSYICHDATIFSHNCNEVNVFAKSESADYVLTNASIYAPYQGNLNVEIDSGNYGFLNGHIISNESNNIFIDLKYSNKVSLGGSLTIDAADATGTVELICDGGCKASSIHCPYNDLTDGTSCIIDCQNVSTALSTDSSQCGSLSIYTKYGIPRDVRYECQGSSSSVCSGSLVWCKRNTADKSCSYSYDSGNSVWDCSGSFCVYPTVAPTAIPTSVPSAPTDTPSSTPSHNPTQIPTSNSSTTMQPTMGNTQSATQETTLSAQQSTLTNNENMTSTQGGSITTDGGGSSGSGGSGSGSGSGSSGNSGNSSTDNSGGLDMELVLMILGIVIGLLCILIIVVWVRTQRQNKEFEADSIEDHVAYETNMKETNDDMGPSMEMEMEPQELEMDNGNEYNDKNHNYHHNYNNNYNNNNDEYDNDYNNENEEYNDENEDYNNNNNNNNNNNDNVNTEIAGELNEIQQIVEMNSEESQGGSVPAFSYGVPLPMAAAVSQDDGTEYPRIQAEMEDDHGFNEDHDNAEGGVVTGVTPGVTPGNDEPDVDANTNPHMTTMNNSSSSNEDDDDEQLVQGLTPGGPDGGPDDGPDDGMNENNENELQHGQDLCDSDATPPDIDQMDHLFEANDQENSDNDVVDNHMTPR